LFALYFNLFVASGVVVVVLQAHSRQGLNGKWTGCHSNFSNKWHFPIIAHIHTPMAESAMQGNSLARRQQLGYTWVSCSGAGINFEVVVQNPTNQAISA
jgi:hypothetical protein